MIGWLQQHWDTIALVASVLLNALGVTGKVPPIGTPRGFARMTEDDSISGER